MTFLARQFSASSSASKDQRLANSEQGQAMNLSAQQSHSAQGQAAPAAPAQPETSSMASRDTSPTCDNRIMDVWADNFDDKFDEMLALVEDFPYVAFDTEYPGLVIENVVEPYWTATQANYVHMKNNVNALKLIQLGITFSDKEGNRPPAGPVCWQFNFAFDLEKDMYASDAIDLLQNASLDFQKFSNKGIATQLFGEKFMSSGLVLNENIKWISFHGLFDFGYLLKLLTGLNLPDESTEFFESLDLFFPQR